jgi:hypothetical protein
LWRWSSARISASTFDSRLPESSDASEELLGRLVGPSAERSFSASASPVSCCVRIELLPESVFPRLDDEDAEDELDFDLLLLDEADDDDELESRFLSAAKAVGPAATAAAPIARAATMING